MNANSWAEGLKGTCLNNKCKACGIDGFLVARGEDLCVMCRMIGNAAVETYAKLYKESKDEIK